MVTGDNVLAAAPTGKSIDQQAYEQTKIPTETAAAPSSSGVLNKPEDEEQVA